MELRDIIATSTEEEAEALLTTFLDELEPYSNRVREMLDVDLSDDLMVIIPHMTELDSIRYHIDGGVALARSLMDQAAKIYGLNVELGGRCPFAIGPLYKRWVSERILPYRGLYQGLVMLAKDINERVNLCKKVLSEMPKGG